MKILARCQFCLLTVCVHSRGMASLGVTSDQYGSLLIPIIMSKLLSEIRLQIARNSKDSVWKMDEFSNVIKMARWRKQARTENHPKHRDMPNFVINPHFSVLWSHSKVRAANRKCVFCWNVHYLASCDVVKDTAKWRNILERDKRCFNCLRFGHDVKECSNRNTCRHCGQRHHQSICSLRDQKSAKPKEISPEETTTTTTTVRNKAKGIVLL